MKIPDKLKVGGHTYKIIRDYKFQERTDLIAQAEHISQEIRLAPMDVTGNEMHPEKMEEMFLHELLHCVDNVFNGQKIDEASITNFSEGLCQVLKENNLL